MKQKLDIESFFQSHLRHSRGKWAGQAFNLAPWQTEMLRQLFLRKPDGNRKHKLAYIEIPRKNGKSTLAAGLALYMLTSDGEPGAHVYGCAADTDQARIVFSQAKEMISSSPILSKICTPLRNEIIMKPLKKGHGPSIYKVLSAEAYSKHGYQPSCIIFDELHAQPNRELWDVMTTGTASRKNPLTVAITTAGYDRNSICWELHEYARQVASGAIEDDAFYGLIYAAEESDDWMSPEIWRKANPNFGISVDADYMEREANRAKNSPSYQNTFRRLHLNQWTSQDSRWLDMRLWDDCDDPIPWDKLKNRPCWAALDLASTIDIAAFVMCFNVDDKYVFVPHFWIPEENMLERSRRDRVPYEVWVRQGLMQATPGNCIWLDQIYSTISKAKDDYDIREIPFDRWGATGISQRLEDDGHVMVQFGQGFASMSPPTKAFLNLVMEKRIVHGGNPILRWMADNVVITQDAAGNIKPNKAKSTEKIDGIVAAIMALSRAMLNEGNFDPAAAVGHL